MVEGMDPEEAQEFLKKATVWQDKRKQPQLKHMARLAGDRFDLLQKLSATVAACEDTATTIAGAPLLRPSTCAGPARPCPLECADRGMLAA